MNMRKHRKYKQNKAIHAICIESKRVKDIDQKSGINYSWRIKFYLYTDHPRVLYRK